MSTEYDDETAARRGNLFAGRVVAGPYPVAAPPAQRRAAGERNLAEKRQAKLAAWARHPAILKTHHRIVCADARVMPGLDAPESVHLVVTSPPYWDLKRYGDDCDGRQLGHIADRQAFLGQLESVWRRCLRLLVPGGRLCVVVGDVCRSRRKHGRHMVEPLHAYIQVQCQALGFDPLAPIVWSKVANLTTEVGGSSAFLGKPYEPNAIVKNDIEYILMFRKPGGYRHPTQEQRDLSLIDEQDHRRWFQQIWTDIQGESQRDHPAPFPVELVRRLIGMFSFVGDTVLDPFWGVGNTTLAAMDMHRSSIGFEIDPAYVACGRARLGTPPFDSTVEFAHSLAIASA